MLDGDSKTTLGMHAILKNCSWGVAMILKSRKTGLRDCKKGVRLSHIKSGTYNSIKYGLKGMRHKNANMSEYPFHSNIPIIKELS